MLKASQHNTLEIDSVILDFEDIRVLQDVYLKSETGKISGLLGRNGTGKTCLMNIIFGDLSPNDKSIRLNGKSFNSNYRSPADIKYLPQLEFTPKNLTIKQLFSYFNLDFSDFYTLFPNMERRYSSKLRGLSEGERRIVDIYSIVTSNSRFCMLDEPFSQIAPIHIDTIKKLIVREKTTKGIIITDHLYKHIIDICDSLYVISNGKTYLTQGLQDLERLGYIRNL